MKTRNRTNSGLALVAPFKPNKSTESIHAPCSYEPPKTGMRYSVHGVMGTIIRVYPAGTMDVERDDGECFRVTGLPFR